MRKNKTIKTVSFALILTLLLSGCGENAEKPIGGLSNDNTYTQDNTALNQDNEKPEQPLGEYDFYDLLDAEYQKYGISSVVRIGETPKYLYGTNKLARNIGFQETKIQIFDISTGEWSDGIKCSPHWSSIYYVNGKFYGSSIASNSDVITCNQDIRSTEADKLEFTHTNRKFEHIQGKEIETVSYDIEEMFCNTDNELVIVQRSRDDVYDTVAQWISSDGKTKKYIPKPMVETDYGTERNDFCDSWIL